MKHPFSQFKYCPKCGSNQFQVNNEKSKKCDNCGFVYYFNPCAATVALITNSKNELLVCRRGKDPAKGTLDLPGGFTDSYESAETGIIREVLEETGLTVTNVTYLFSLPNIYEYSGFDVHTLDLFFRCEVMEIQGLEANDDVSDTFYMPFEEICIEDFGLRSIREGVLLFLKEV